MSDERCQICKRRHVTESDHERAVKAGNVTAYNVAKAEEAYHHYMAKQKPSGPCIGEGI